MKKVIFALLVITFASCTTTQKTVSDSFVTIENRKIYLFADEYGNGYMKQRTECGVIYIPFVFPYADEDSTTTKNKY